MRNDYNRIVYVDRSEFFEIHGKPFTQLKKKIEDKKTDLFKDLIPFYYKEMGILYIAQIPQFKPQIVVFDPNSVQIEQLKEKISGVKFIAYASELEEQVLDDKLYGADLVMKKGNGTGHIEAAQMYKTALLDKELKLRDRLIGFPEPKDQTVYKRNLPARKYNGFKGSFWKRPKSI